VGVSCGPDPPDAPPIATLADFSIQLTSTPVHAGVNEFVIRNMGPAEHEFIAFKIEQPIADLALTAAGDLDEEVLTNVSDGPNLAPLTSATREVELTGPGTYLFVCNLPGHFEKGMYTIVTLP
jgi:uncharacterized cupredoxin-like copper-binding protein